MSARKLLLNCRLNSLLRQSATPLPLQRGAVDGKQLPGPTFALLLPQIPLPRPLSTPKPLSATAELWFVGGHFLQPSEFPLNSSTAPLLTLLNSIALVALLLPPPPLPLIDANS